MRRTNLSMYKPYQQSIDYWDSWKLVVADKMDEKMIGSYAELTELLGRNRGTIGKFVSLKESHDNINDMPIPSTATKELIDRFLGITEEEIKAGMLSMKTKQPAEKPVDDVVEEGVFNREATLMQLAQMMIRDQSIKKLLADNGISIEFQSIFARTDEQLKILMNLIAENDKINKIKLNQYIGIRPTAGATTIHKAIVLMTNKDQVDVILQKRHPSREDEKIWVITTIRDKNLIEVPDEVEMAGEDDYKKICSSLEKMETDRARASFALTSSKIVYDADYTG